MSPTSPQKSPICPPKSPTSLQKSSALFQKSPTSLQKSPVSLPEYALWQGVVTWRAAPRRRVRVSRPRLVLLLPSGIRPGAGGTHFWESTHSYPCLCFIHVHVYIYLHTRKKRRGGELDNWMGFEVGETTLCNRLYRFEHILEQKSSPARPSSLMYICLCTLALKNKSKHACIHYILAKIRIHVRMNQKNADAHTHEYKVHIYTYADTSL